MSVPGPAAVRPRRAILLQPVGLATRSRASARPGSGRGTWRSSGYSLVRRERERLVVLHGEDDEAAATIADVSIDLIKVTDEKLPFLGAVGV